MSLDGGHALPRNCCSTSCHRISPSAQHPSHYLTITLKDGRKQTLTVGLPMNMITGQFTIARRPRSNSSWECFAPLAPWRASHLTICDMRRSGAQGSPELRIRLLDFAREGFNPKQKKQNWNRKIDGFERPLYRNKNIIRTI